MRYWLSYGCLAHLHPAARVIGQLGSLTIYDPANPLVPGFKNKQHASVHQFIIYQLNTQQDEVLHYCFALGRGCRRHSYAGSHACKSAGDIDTGLGSRKRLTQAHSLVFRRPQPPRPSWLPLPSRPPSMTGSIPVTCSRLGRLSAELATLGKSFSSLPCTGLN